MISLVPRRRHATGTRALRRGMLVALVGAASCLALTGTASASWSAPSPLSFPAGVQNQTLALGAGGEEALGWSSYDSGSGTYSVEVTTRASRTAAWGAPAVLSVAGSPSFAISGSGAAAAIWTASGGAVQAAVLTPGGSWSQPATFAAAGSSPQIGVGADGQAVAVWLDSGQTEIDSAAYEADSNGKFAWSASSSVSQVDGNLSFQLAVGDGGDAALAFDQPNGGTATADCAQEGGEVGNYSYSTDSFILASRPAGGSWGTQTLRGGDGRAGADSLSVSQSGAASMLWSYSVPDQYNCFTNGSVDKATYSQIGGGGGDTTTLAGGSGSYPSTVGGAVDAQGNALVVWSQNSTYYSSFHPSAGGGWGASDTIGSLTQAPAGMALADGDAALLFTQTDQSNGTSSIEALDSSAGGGWDSPQTLASGLNSAGPALAGSPDGYLLASWPDNNGAWQGSWHDPAPLAPTITQGPPAQTNQSSATFAFATSDSNGSFQCQLDEAAFAPCDSPKTYSGLGDGHHAFAVRVLGADGTAGPSATQEWSIDTTAPATSITAKDDTGEGTWAATTTLTSASFSFSSSKPGSSFACSLDGAAPVACQSPKSYSGLSVGSHTFRVAATDSLGNIDPRGAAASWAVASGAGSPPSCGASRDRSSRDISTRAAGDGATCTISSRPAALPGCKAKKQSLFNIGTACVPDTPSCPRGLPQRAIGPYVLLALTEKACFRGVKGLYLSRGPVKINGLTLTLPRGGELVVDYGGGRVYTRGGMPHLQIGNLGSIPLPINSKWHGLPGTGSSHVKISPENSKVFERVRKALLLKKMPVIVPELEFEHGAADFDAGHGGSTRLDLKVELPSQLERPGHHGYEATLYVKAEISFSNGNGTQLNFAAGVPKVDVLHRFEVHDLQLSFDSLSQSLSADATLEFPRKIPLEGPFELELGITFKGWHVAGWKAIARNLNLPIQPEACLQSIGLEKSINTNMNSTGRVYNDQLQATGEVWMGLPVVGGPATCQLEPLRIHGRITLGTVTNHPGEWLYLQLEGKGSLYQMHFAYFAMNWDFRKRALSFNGALDVNLGILHGKVQIPVGGGKLTKHGLEVMATGDLTPRFPAIFNPIAHALSRHEVIHINSKGIVVCNKDIGSHFGVAVPWSGGIGAIKYYDHRCNIHALG